MPLLPWPRLEAVCLVSLLAVVTVGCRGGPQKSEPEWRQVSAAPQPTQRPAVTVAASTRVLPTRTPVPVLTADPARPESPPGCAIVGRFDVCVEQAGRAPGPGPEYERLPPGHEYAIFRVAYRNTSAEEWGFDPADLELVDGNGVVRRRNNNLPGGAPRMQEGRLVPGGNTSGLISFAIPVGDVRYSLRYRVANPFAADSVLARWVLR